MFLCGMLFDGSSSSSNVNFKNLFCITCILFTLVIELNQYYISMPYLILEKMNAWYNRRATLGGYFVFNVIEYSNVFHQWFT